jgi:acylphosphatase
MSVEKREAAEILVEGRVQGVGYRDFCVWRAQALGLVGYAMNLAEGAVRVMAEGERARIEALVRELERGPRLARVERVSVTWVEPSGRFSGFGIEYAGRNA